MSTAATSPSMFNAQRSNTLPPFFAIHGTSDESFVAPITSPSGSRFANNIHSSLAGVVPARPNAPRRRSSALEAHQAALRNSGPCYSPPAAIAGLPADESAVELYSPVASPMGSPTRASAAKSRSGSFAMPWNSVDGKSMLPLAPGWTLQRRCSDESDETASSGGKSWGIDSMEVSPTNVTFGHRAHSPTELQECMEQQRERPSRRRNSSYSVQSEPAFLLSSHASVRRSSQLRSDGSTTLSIPKPRIGSRSTHASPTEAHPPRSPAYLPCSLEEEEPVRTTWAQRDSGVEVCHLASTAIAARHTALVSISNTRSEAAGSDRPTLVPRRASSSANLRARRLNRFDLRLDTNIAREQGPGSAPSDQRRSRAVSSPAAHVLVHDASESAALLPSPMVGPPSIFVRGASMPPGSSEARAECQASSASLLSATNVASRLLGDGGEESECESDGTLTPNCYAPLSTEAASANAVARRSFAKEVRRREAGISPIDVAIDRQLAPTPPLGSVATSLMPPPRPRIGASTRMAMTIADPLDGDASPLNLPPGLLWAIDETIEVPAFKDQLPLELPHVVMRAQMEEDLEKARRNARRCTVSGALTFKTPPRFPATPSSMLAAAAEARLMAASRETRRAPRPMSWAAGSGVTLEALSRLDEVSEEEPAVREFSSEAAQVAVQSGSAVAQQPRFAKPARPAKSKLRMLSPTAASASIVIEDALKSPVPPSLRSDIFSAATTQRRASQPIAPPSTPVQRNRPVLVAPKAVLPGRPAFISASSFGPASPTRRSSLSSRIPSLDEGVASTQAASSRQRRHSILHSSTPEPIIEEHRLTPRPTEVAAPITTSGALLLL